jgi:hypothetical protein
MTYQERKDLEAASVKCFGSVSGYKRIMKRGRLEKMPDGFIYRVPITLDEVIDTMDYLLLKMEEIKDEQVQKG